MPPLLLLGVGLVWLLEAHPANKRRLPAKTTDRANPRPRLPLNNDNPPPIFFNIPKNNVTGNLLSNC
jgi:hypothetical protein